MLRAELGRGIGAAVGEILLSEIANAPVLARAVAAEAAALHSLIEPLRTWLDARRVRVPEPSTQPLFADEGGSLLAAQRAGNCLLCLLEQEGERRAGLPPHRRLADGAATPHGGPEAIADWITARAVDLAAGPMELTIAEAVVVIEQEVPLPVGPTWWQNPKAALARWTSCFHRVFAPPRVRRRRS